MDKHKFYEVCFGIKTDKADGYYDEYQVRRGLIDSEYSIVIKADHLPSCEEAEAFCKKDLEASKHDGVVSVARISTVDVYHFFDTECIEKWPVLSAMGLV